MHALVLIYAIGFSVLVGVPLVVAPIAWARALGWRAPDQPELAIYFARCLGGVVVAIAIVAGATASDPRGQEIMLDVICAALAAMTVVHALGWIRKQQPRSEDLETLGYAALFALTMYVRFA